MRTVHGRALMIDVHWIVGLLVTTLLGAASFMIKNWASTWQNRIIAQDKRLDDHDQKHANHDKRHDVLDTKLDNMKEKIDETSADVKTLIRQSNGRGNTG